MSRRLDLENTRKLVDGEEPVLSKEGNGIGEMVFDMCDAKFSVYQELDESHETETSGLAKYQGKTAKVKTCIIALSTPSPPHELQSSFLGLWKARAPKELRIFSTVYRNAGANAQPNEHPKIESELVGGGKWLVLILIVDHEGAMLKVEHVEMMVEEWLGGKKEQGLNDEVRFGVWEGEVEVD
jgi:hypothetical protein